MQKQSESGLSGKDLFELFYYFVRNYNFEIKNLQPLILHNQPIQ